VRDGGADPDAKTETIGSSPAAGVNPELPEPAAPGPSPGTRLGRFVIVRRIGAGGMGAVYEARDEVLGRRVALKLVHAGGDAPRVNRILREARAAAGLAHPNIVTVYEVGSSEYGPYIVMEYIDGQTLRAWLSVRARSWREVLGMFLPAAEGLAAAHEAGLIHCDVKPDNILVDGNRVKVADFGLARAATTAPDAMVSPSATSALAGTPRYMAPERWQGHVDVRSDQYGWCAGLLEALGGKPPQRGAAPSAEGVRGAPAWLIGAVLRGLAVDPAERHPDMRSVIMALRHDPARRRRHLVIAAGALGIAGVVAATAWMATPSSSCGDGASRLAGVWDSEIATHVERAFERLDLPHARRVWPIVRDRMDRYRARWIETHLEICKSARRGERSPRALDLGVACLDRGRAHLHELGRRLSAPDRATVSAAIDAVDALPDVAQCADLEQLAIELAPPPDAIASKIAMLGEELSRIEALGNLRDLDAATTRAEAAVATARTLAYAPALADALSCLGQARTTAEKHAEAIAPLEEALSVAFAARHDIGVAKILIMLIRVGASLDSKDVDRWFSLGTAAIDRLGGNRQLEASLRCSYVGRFLAANRHRDLLEHARTCVELTEQAHGADSARYGSALSRLGAAQNMNGAYREGRRSLIQALDLIERHQGPDYPTLVETLTTLAATERRIGELDAALDHAKRALAIKTSALGPDDPRLASLHQNVAAILNDRGEFAAALPFHEAAHRFYAARLGADHPRIGESLGNLAIVHELAGKHDQARAFARQSLQLFERVHDEPHEHLVNAHTLLGTIERARGELDTSLDHLERAVALLDQVFDKGHAQRVNPMMELAHTWNARGDHRRAVEILQNVEPLLASSNVPPQWVGEARFALAGALVSAGRDRRRARDQAVQARDVYRKLGPPFAAQVAEIDDWLAKHAD
jgi:eukaryotic-like serine/threonine-protein kinase